MIARHTFLTLLLVGLLAVPVALHAQAEQTPERLVDETDTPVTEKEPEQEPVEVPASNVVDVNEENFRRSMELRDRELQRSPDLTTGSYSRRTGLQALEGLPEESQKHLREQLREVIVENGPWVPEDAGHQYPYIPSEGAETNDSLARREKAAWDEMVAEYHEREAAIHANAVRTQAATATGQSPDNHSAGDGSESEQGQEGKPGFEGDPSTEDSARSERTSALAGMSSSQEAASANADPGQAQPVETGTQQNALELLTSRNQVPAQPQEAASSVAATQSVSAEESQATLQAEDKDSASEDRDPTIDFDSDDVIAIEDLDKVNADPEDPDSN